MSKDILFSRKCGKWILTGEHILVRGGRALSFPLKELCLDIQYKPKAPLSFLFDREFSDSKKNKSFEEVVKQAFFDVGKKPSGSFYLSSKIPLGYGLGSSAAFCLALSDIFFQLGYIQDVVDFAWELEHVFHGKSSGLDIQTVYHQQPLIFRSSKNFEFFESKWHPHIYLYNTGISSLTKQCVEKVSHLFDQFPEKSANTYKKMETSVGQSIIALSNPSEDLKLLTQAINGACDCFDEWGLLEPLRSSIAKLKDLGALAVKPTGAGAGGYLIGLWKNPLPSSQPDKCFLPISI